MAFILIVFGVPDSSVSSQNPVIRGGELHVSKERGDIMKGGVEKRKGLL